LKGVFAEFVAHPNLVMRLNSFNKPADPMNWPPLHIVIGKAVALTRMTPIKNPQNYQQTWVFFFKCPFACNPFIKK